MLRTTIVLASLAAACGDSDSSSLLGGDPIGRWRELPNATDDDPPDPLERAEFEFVADGTYIERNPGAALLTGTWDSFDGFLVITEDGETTGFELPYYASADRLVLGALIPTGEVDGAIGTWTATVEDVNEGQRTTVVTTLALRADHTVSLRYDSELGEDEAFVGTWTNVGDDLLIEFAPNENFIIDFEMSLVDGVLGTPFERL